MPTLPNAQQIVGALNPNPQDLRDRAQLEELMKAYRDMQQRMAAPAPVNQELIDAQKASEEQQRAATLGEAFSRISAGMAGLGSKSVVKPDIEAFAPIREAAKRQVQNVKELQESQAKMREKQLQEAKAAFDVQRQKVEDLWSFDKHKREAEKFATDQKKAAQDLRAGEKDMQLRGKQIQQADLTLAKGTIENQLLSETADPRSDISKFAREYGTSQFKMNVPENTSAAQMDIYFKYFKDKSLEEEKLKLSKDRLDLLKDQQERLKDAQKWKEKEKNELSDKQTSTISGYDKSLALIDNIMAQKGNVDTGPLSNLQNAVAQSVGIDDPKKSAFKSDVTDQLVQYIKSISGTAVSEPERRLLLQAVPKLSDNDKTFMAKLDHLRQRLATFRDVELKSIEKQGKDIDTFGSKEEYDGQMLIVQGPKGPKDRLKVKRKDLQNWIARGYKLLPID